MRSVAGSMPSDLNGWRKKSRHPPSIANNPSRYNELIMDNIETYLSATNVYIDESGHTNDPASRNMVLGALWVSAAQLSLLTDAVRTVKKKHSIAPHREIKWTKVSQSKLDYYIDLVDVFFDIEQLNYRAVIIDKSKVDHEAHGKTPDSFYYTMQYLLVRTIAEKRLGDIHLFLDYKDTWSGVRTTELARYLNNTGSLHNKSLRAQPLRSHEVTGLQISDLFTGAVAYANQPTDLQLSSAKKKIVEHIEHRSKQSLNHGTPYGAEKINLLFWEPRK